MASVDKELPLPWFFQPDHCSHAYPNPSCAPAIMRNVGERLKEDYLQLGWQADLCTVVNKPVIISINPKIPEPDSPTLCFLFRFHSDVRTTTKPPSSYYLFKEGALEGHYDDCTWNLKPEPLTQALAGTNLVALSIEGGYNAFSQLAKSGLLGKAKPKRVFDHEVAYVCVGTEPLDVRVARVQAEMQTVRNYYKGRMGPLKEELAQLRSLRNPETHRKPTQKLFILNLR